MEKTVLSLTDVNWNCLIAQCELVSKLMFETRSTAERETILKMFSEEVNEYHAICLYG